MGLLIVSQFVAGDPVAYGLLLAATACLGAGFGLTAPTLNMDTRHGLGTPWTYQ
jgi:hypothetical protein